MDTNTQVATRTYTATDSQDGVILSIVLGVILGIAANAVSMLTGFSLDSYMLLSGGLSVGIGVFALGTHGDKMRLRLFNQLFGLVTTIVISAGTYGLLHLI